MRNILSSRPVFTVFSRNKRTAPRLDMSVIPRRKAAAAAITADLTPAAFSGIMTAGPYLVPVTRWIE
ncbi:MAG: hypothetical protein WDO13_15490 [Verrucomicrobiota bacterium]